MSLIVTLLTASTILSDLSSFSLVNIAFELSLCLFDTLLDVSAVTLFASDIDSSFMALRIAYQIFTLNNEILLWSL